MPSGRRTNFACNQEVGTILFQLSDKLADTFINIVIGVIGPNSSDIQECTIKTVFICQRCDLFYQSVLPLRGTRIWGAVGAMVIVPGAIPVNTCSAEIAGCGTQFAGFTPCSKAVMMDTDDINSRYLLK